MQRKKMERKKKSLRILGNMLSMWTDTGLCTLSGLISSCMLLIVRFEYWEVFASTLSRLWIKIWHFNSLSNSLQGDFQKKLNIPITYEGDTTNSTQQSSPIY